MSMLALTGLEPFAIPAEDEALRADLRAFLTEAIANMPAERRARSWGGFDADFTRELARRGYIGLTIPREYGGQGRSAFARFVVVEELLNFGAPVAAHWIADRQSGPLILKYGTEAQKQKYLPAICRGEAAFGIGMSEPNSGSDLASIRTRAVREDGGWRLNGQKIWTTHGHNCAYLIALVRTSGEASDRQKGLSQLIIDLKAPGITCRPIRDLTGDAHFSEIFFDDVLLGEDSLVGTEGEGWHQVTAELAFERSGPERFYTCMVLLDEWLAFVRSEGQRSPQSEVLAGRLISRMAPLRAISLVITARIEAGESPVVEAALAKDIGTSIEQYIPEAIADDLMGRGDVDLPHGLLDALAYTSLAAPSYSLRGGTREILRGMIARGLGLR